nr:hypothetical protein [Tanacetum cinerariifolium]GEW13868.1 hypothetical protein [Tanacetum cinerariifolium]
MELETNHLMELKLNLSNLNPPIANQHQKNKPFNFFFPEESDEDDEPAKRENDMETTYDEDQLINQQIVAHIPPPEFGEENVEIDSLITEPFDTF